MNKSLNKNVAKGKWKEFKGKLREQWGKITDDELEQTRGDTEQIAGKLQQKYGITIDQAKSHVEAAMEDSQRKSA